jgi:hypothetical protein
MVVRPTTKRAAWQADDDRARTQACGTMVSPPTSKTTGWAPACKCPDAAAVPATVLDPFGGSGTVGEVATTLGRHAVLVEINPAYAKIADRRTAQEGLFTQAAAVPA